MITYDLSLYPNLPKYQALYTLMREDILAGVLASGFRLPSRRALAEHQALEQAVRCQAISAVYAVAAGFADGIQVGQGGLGVLIYVNAAHKVVLSWANGDGLLGDIVAFFQTLLIDVGEVGDDVLFGHVLEGEAHHRRCRHRGMLTSALAWTRRLCFGTVDIIRK